jgi:hypothetical protein
MQTLLIVAMLIVGVAVLYVAATLGLRTKQNTAPLIDGAIKKTSAEIEATAGELSGQLQAIAAELRRDREKARLEERKIQGRLDHADRQIANMSERFLAELAALRRLGEQIGARQDQFGDDLRQLGHRVTRLQAHEGGEDNVPAGSTPVVPDGPQGPAEATRPVRLAPEPAHPVDWAAAPVPPPARTVREPPPETTDLDPDLGWPPNPRMGGQGSR